MSVAWAWYVTETSSKYNQYTVRIPKGTGLVGLICSLSFDVQRRRGLARCGPFRIDRKRREDKGSVKIGHFSWMSKMYGPILISKMAAVFFFKFHPKIPK